MPRPTVYVRSPFPDAAALWAEYVAHHGGDLRAAYHDLLLVSDSLERCRLVSVALSLGRVAIRRASVPVGDA